MSERPDILRLLEESKRELAESIRRSQFEDMGYDDCATCRRARLRAAFKRRRAAQAEHIAALFDGTTKPRRDQ